MYDPLLDKNPGQGEAYPSSYWRETLETSAQYQTLKQDEKADVVVIGAGFTGLSCAYFLAKQYGKKVILLEANQIGWGCSGRNAGFVLQSSGRLGFGDIIKKWGKPAAHAMYDEYQAGVSLVRQLIEEGDIECDALYKGYLKVAHKPSQVALLKAQAELLQREFGDPVRFIDEQELKGYMNSRHAHGALLFPNSFGINPLKLVHGYAAMAEKAGVQIYTGTPALQINSSANGHTITTPQGTVHAEHLVLAGNGYTPQGLHKAVNGRFLPVLSSIIVTRPLTEQEIAAAGLQVGVQVMDTRELKYYYRLLPDGRILFGGRGAIQGKNADDPVFKQRLIEALHASFPMLKQVGVDYFWSGWISVSLDDLPRVWSENKVHYATGYCGSGVSFTVQAGKRLAQSVAGEGLNKDLPLFASPLKPFPLAPLRRVGQWGFYQWGRFKDAYL